MDLNLTSSKNDNNPSTGTTIAAIVYKDGVILAADTRMTTGRYICSRASTKISQLTSHVYLGRSGGASHTQILGDYVSSYAEEHELSLRELSSVYSVAYLIKMMQYRNQRLMTQFLVAGWDPVDGPQVYSIPSNGNMIREKWALGGSGSTYLYGLCQSSYKDDMSYEEAENFVKMLISFAYAKDSNSGGMCRIVNITKDGAERKTFVPKDLPQPVGECFNDKDLMEVD